MMEGRVHIGYADGVGMGVEHQRFAAAAARDQDDVGAFGRCLLDVDFQAGVSPPGGDVVGDVAFARGPGHQIGIDRIDGDEIGYERAEFIHVVSICVFMQV